MSESKVCVGSESEWSIDSAGCTRPGLQAEESLFSSLDNDCDNLWLRRREETKRQHLLRRLHHYWEFEGHQQQSRLARVFHLHAGLKDRVGILV